jgi:hypothetical protein
MGIPYFAKNSETTPEECPIALSCSLNLRPTETNILCTAFLLIPVTEHSTFHLCPNIFQWIPLILLFWILKDDLSICPVTTLTLLSAFHAIQTHLSYINILHLTHFSTYQTFQKLFSLILHKLNCFSLFHIETIQWINYFRKTTVINHTHRNLHIIHIQNNGEVSKVNNLFLTLHRHNIHCQQQELPKVLVRVWTSFQDGVTAGKGFVCALFWGVQIYLWL